MSASPGRAPSGEGTLAIGCLPWMCRDRLADLLVAFGRAAPAVDVGMQDMARADLLPALVAGTLDLVVMPTRPLTDRPSRMLWRERAALAVSRDHSLADAVEIDPAAVGRTDLLIAQREQGCEMHGFLTEQIRFAGSPGGRLIDAGLAQLLDAVAAGAGAALVPESCSAREDIVLLPFANGGGGFTVRAYWRDRAPAEPLVALIRSLPAADGD